MTHPKEAIEAVERPMYLIRKQGMWYRPNSQGYTSSAILAGRYTLADAINITHPNGNFGPRDGMSYCHEDAITDEDWAAYAALRAALDHAEADKAAAVEAERLKRFEWLAKRHKISSLNWLRAAKAAHNGNWMELENRIAMAEADPVEIVLSDASAIRGGQS